MWLSYCTYKQFLRLRSDIIMDGDLHWALSIMDNMDSASLAGNTNSNMMFPYIRSRQIPYLRGVENQREVIEPWYDLYLPSEFSSDESEQSCRGVRSGLVLFPVTLVEYHVHGSQSRISWHSIWVTFDPLRHSSIYLERVTVSITAPTSLFYLFIDTTTVCTVLLLVVRDCLRLQFIHTIIRFRSRTPQRGNHPKTLPNLLLCSNKSDARDFFCQRRHVPVRWKQRANANSENDVLRGWKWEPWWYLFEK